MQNYKLTIQYDGTKYNGWQRQRNTKNTLQEKFENVLSRMCGKETEIFASGRTDAGVHAKGQVANFKCETKLSCNEIADYLNCYLPEDVRVLSVVKADERFHSRLSAISKTYEYVIATKKPDVFIRKYVFETEKTPDLDLMRTAADKLLGKHDFKGFSSVGRTKKSTVREINFINIEEKDAVIKIAINADGFLYNMVRIIAGTLLDIGAGDLELSAIDKVFETKVREYAGTTLPGKGLSLIEVQY